MAYNNVPNGSIFYAADWASFQNHNHTSEVREGRNLNALSFVADNMLEGVPETSYRQLQVTTFTNRDRLAADYFNIGSGKNYTVSPPNSTSIYNSSSYIGRHLTNQASGDTTYNPDGATWEENAFDDNDGTPAQVYGAFSGLVGKTLGKIFSTPRYIKSIRLNVWVGTETIINTGMTIVLKTYDGSTWNTVTTLASSGSEEAFNISYNDVYTLNSTVQGIAIYMTVYNRGTPDIDDFRWYTISYGVCENTYVVCNNILPLDGSEKTCLVYANNLLPGSTSMNVNLSDGTNTIYNQTLGQIINIGSLSTGSLGLIFNLNTTNGSYSPSFYGYGVYINK